MLLALVQAMAAIQFSPARVLYVYGLWQSHFKWRAIYMRG